MMAITNPFKRKRGRPKGSTKDKLTAKDWLGKIERAKKVRERWATQQRIQIALQYWEGMQRPDQFEEDEWITVNLVYSTLMAELPVLYSTDPEFHVRLKKSYDPDENAVVAMEEIGKSRASMLNYLGEELDMKTKARQGIFDAEFAYGVMKVHYTADMVDHPQKGEPVLDDDGGVLVDENDSPIMYPDQVPANEAYNITRIHFDDFLVDEDAGPLNSQDVKWRAQRIKTSLKKAKSNERYNASARAKLKATELTDDQKKREERKKGGTLSTDSNQKEPDIVVLWEVYDRERGEWFTVAEGNNSEYLADPAPIPPGIEIDPFSVLRFTQRDDSWYPVSPTGQLVDPQREYCELRSYMLRHRKNVSQRKFVLYGSAFDDPDDAASSLATGGDGTVLIAERNPGFEPVSPIRDAPLDQSQQAELAYLRNDFNELAVGVNQRGAGTGIDSATEAGIIAQAAGIRTGDRKQLIAEWVTDIGRKLDQLVQANITEDQLISVTGKDGDKWKAIKTTDYKEIDGEFRYSVTMSNRTPYSPEIERAQWIQLISALMQAPQIMLSRKALQNTAELFQLEDDTMIEELYQIGQIMMQGQNTQTPGGGVPGVPNQSTEVPSAQGGTAAGHNNIRGGQQ
jgi:hypothetical protein